VQVTTKLFYVWAEQTPYTDGLWSSNQLSVICWYTTHLLFVWGLVYCKWLHQNSCLLLEC